jgi:hypothetical protein
VHPCSDARPVPASRRFRAVLYNRQKK